MNSLYSYIEEELGLKIDYAKKEITVQKATEPRHRTDKFKFVDFVRR